ncbi:MAG: T9SS type A sorting domain-containing protein [Bacteroidia bacterium]
MKKTITFLLVLASIQNAFSQTATSVQNGTWLNPTTWDCNCIPVMNYSVTINNNVTLNTSMSFTSATSGITINNGGSLLQDNGTRDILINGGSFTNNGIFNTRYFYTQSSSNTGMNAGTMTLSAFTNSVVFENHGNIIVDSLTNTSMFTNYGLLKVDSLTNTSTGEMENRGFLSTKWSTNDGNFINEKHMDGIAHTNYGSFLNSDSLLLSQGLWNANVFYNQIGYIHLGGGFYNYNHNTHTAVFDNVGQVIVLDSWYNTDTVKGSAGSFTVQDSSVNSGYMKDDFYFCDYSPINTNQVVDYNTGSISSQITSCNLTDIEKYNQADFHFYPNPTNQILNIDCSALNETTEFQITDALGNSVKQFKIYNSQSKIDVADLNSGIYFIRIGNSTQKFIKQ